MDIGDDGLMRVLILALLSLILFSSICQASEENDLWLLLSSYEDIGITVKDLAFFLASHGYDATPELSYVTVKLSSGKEVYLTPNGGAPRLADLWMTPPINQTGPVKVLSSDAIKINETYSKTNNEGFIKTVDKYLIFPVTPLGMCYDGSQKLADAYRSFGLHVIYLYTPSGSDNQGHLWVVIEDKDHPNTWLAVDSYFGVIKNDKDYYTAPYSFDDFKYLDSINPKWRVA